MREQIKKILELYEQGLSLGEICEEMNLTSGEFNRLLKVIRDSGYNTSKTYTSDGKIFAKINKTLNFKTSNAIRINVKDRILRAVFISDPHIGSEFERPDLLKQVINDYARAHKMLKDNEENLKGEDTREGIVAVKGNVCEGCHMILPAQFANEVHTGDKIVFCPYCSRILYYEEMADGEEHYFPLDDTGSLADLDDEEVDEDEGYDDSDSIKELDY